MIYTVKNDFLKVSVDSKGAQLKDISTADGTQLLWSGDARYWEDSAPVLFPYIARLYGGGYTYLGEKYEMGIHGFAAISEFQFEETNRDGITLSLCENENTLKQYPFRFSLTISYTLEDSKLMVNYAVENRDKKVMPFAIGGHPGFNVPFCKGTDFEDYYLIFSEECYPDRIGFTDELYLSGVNEPYPLKNNRTVQLKHSLFDDDAIVLQNMAKSVTLGCSKTNMELTVSYPDMPYLGIWHMPNTDAPYVCIEPWTSLPSRQAIIEELTCKSDMIFLRPDERYDVGWSLTVKEG